MAANSIQYIFEVLDRYSPALDAMARKQDKFNRAALRGAVKLKKLKKALVGMGRAASRVGNRMKTTVTLPLVALGVASVVSFARLETGLVNVNNLLSRGELKVFGKDLKNMQEGAVKMGFSISDANKGLFDTVSALGASESTFKTFQVAQKLAIAGNVDLSVAVDGLTSVINGYGKETTNATDVANAFFSAQVKGKTTVGELSAAIGSVAPIASKAGVGYKTLLAAMAQMTLGGLSTDEATTSLRATLNALVAPTEQVKKKLDDLKIPFGNALTEAGGFEKALLAIAKAQKEGGLEKVTEVIPNIRALTGVLNLDAKAVENLRAIVRKINSDNKTGDGLSRGFADQYETTAERFKRAKGAMTIAMSKFAEQFAPALEKIATFITKISDKFANMSPAMKRVLVVFGLIAAIIPPLLIAFGAIVAIVGAVSAPILLIGVAVVAVTIAIGVLFAKFVKLVNFIRNNTIGKALGAVKSFFGGTVTNENKTKLDAQIGVEVKDSSNAVKKITTSSKTKGVKLGTNMAR